MNNRWKMNRIGFVNFWLYDEEDFEFEDGKLLLRGQNGSGKSITTQSFIPFVLDGDRTPSRLDPFGSSDRRMEYYFLGEEGRDEATGYLFLEFKKEDTEEKTEEATTEDTTENKEKEPEKTTIFYVTDPVQQSQYINMFKAAGKNAVILSHNIDTPFISHLEQKDQTIQFKRIDADLTDELKADGTADEEMTKTLTDLFRKNLNKEKLEVKVENLKNESVAAMMMLSEESRRMQDMMKMYNMYGMDPSMFGGQETLVLNAKHPLVKYLAGNTESEHSAVICEQLYDLAMLSHKQLSPDEMTRFVQRSNEILMLLAK